jgi:hypothetical protein
LSLSHPVEEDPLCVRRDGDGRGRRRWVAEEKGRYSHLIERLYLKVGLYKYQYNYFCKYQRICL